MGETVLPAAFPLFVLGLEGAPLDYAGPRDANNEALIATPQDAVASQLLPREKTILRCLIDGDSNKSIAQKFRITDGTVKGHVAAILRRVGIDDPHRCRADRAVKIGLSAKPRRPWTIHRSPPPRRSRATVRANPR